MSHNQSLGEVVKGWMGVYQVRCRRCEHRWKANVWSMTGWKFARCPRCYRQELATWSEQYYHPAWRTRMMLRLGATPYRCAACRCNFASFRPCRERFAWKREERLNTP